MIPNLEYKTIGKVTSYRWTNVVDGFAMKVKLTSGTWLSPTTAWRTMKKQEAVSPDLNFYITTSKVN